VDREIIALVISARRETTRVGGIGKFQERDVN
jgi:hypothetical protein